MYETIKKKIERGTYDFNREEIDFIQKNNDLQEELTKLAIYNVNFANSLSEELELILYNQITNKNFLNKILDEIEKEKDISKHLSVSLANFLEPEYSEVIDKKMVLKILNILFKNNKYDEIIKGLNGHFPLDNDAYDIIIKSLEKVVNGIYSLKVPKEIYLKLLEYKRYDILENKFYLDDNELPEEIQKKIIDEYDWEHFQSSSLLNLSNKSISDYVVKKGLLNKLTIYQLLSIKDIDSIKDEIFNIITNKDFSDSYKYLPYTNYINYDNVLTLITDKSEEDTIKFFNQILKGGIPAFLDRDFLRFLIKSSTLPNIKYIKEYISGIYGNIISDVYSISSLEYYFTRKKEYFSVLPEEIKLKLLDNPQVLANAFDASSFKKLFHLGLISNKHVDYATQIIKSGETRFDDLSTDGELLKTYPEIEDALHKRKINCTYKMVLSNFHKYPDFIKRMNDYPDDKYELGDIFYTRLAKNKEIINYLFETKKYQIILDNIGDLLRDYSSEIFNLIKIDNHFSAIFFKKIMVLNGIFEYKEILLYYLKDEEYAPKLIDRINHDETLSKFYTDEIYQTIKKHYENTLNIDRLDIIEQKFGPCIIRFLEAPELKKICDLKDDDFNKFINLFDIKEFKMSQVEAIYDSIKQMEVEIDIFPGILHSIDEGNNVYYKLIEKITPYLDEDFFIWFKDKYEVDIKNPLELLVFITDKIKLQPLKREKYTSILHEITNFYIAKAREEHRNNYDIYKDMKIPTVYEEKSLEKSLIDFFSFHYEKNPTTYVFADGYIKEYDLFFEDVKEYLKKYNWTKVDYQNLYLVLNHNADRLDKSVIKKIMKEYNEACKYSYSQNKLQFKFMDYNIVEDTLNRKIKKLPSLKDDAERRYQILLGINLETLTSTVFENDEMYNLLKEIISKRQIFNIPDFLIDYLNDTISSDEVLDNSVFSAFISLFSEVYSEEKKKLNSQGIKEVNSANFNLIKVIKYGKIYSSLSSIYNLALTKEDANLIRLNPKPNIASKAIPEERLKEAIKFTLNNFKRQEITIPPFEKEYNINGKNITAMVGNFTDSANLTHGERTGSCMRIGGVGSSLFEFALTNKNGFHIVFKDAEGNYLSRVTGFRNGNTVFLNELRCSCLENYQDADIVEACKIVASDLVEFSKSSTLPIDNVVVHRQYATSHIDCNVTLEGNIKEGLPHFYSDVCNNSILLASSSLDEKAVLFNPDKTNLPTYRPLRKKVIKTDNRNLINNYVERVNFVKKSLNGEDYEYIEPLNLQEIVLAYLNDDFYVCLDNNGNIYSDYVPVDDRGIIEYEEAKSKIDGLLKERNYTL